MLKRGHLYGNYFYCIFLRFDEINKSRSLFAYENLFLCTVLTIYQLYQIFLFVNMAIKAIQLVMR